MELLHKFQIQIIGLQNAISKDGHSSKINASVGVGVSYESTTVKVKVRLQLLPTHEERKTKSA